MISFHPRLARAVDLFVCLGDHTRLAALVAISSSDGLTSTDLARRLGVSKTSMHHHLSQLRRHGLIRVSSVIGRKKLYGPTDTQLNPADGVTLRLCLDHADRLLTERHHATDQSQSRKDSRRRPRP